MNKQGKKPKNSEVYDSGLAFDPFLYSSKFTGIVLDIFMRDYVKLENTQWIPRYTLKEIEKMSGISERTLRDKILPNLIDAEIIYASRHHARIYNLNTQSEITKHLFEAYKLLRKSYEELSKNNEISDRLKGSAKDVLQFTDIINNY
ncbi:MAG: hypothetical protein J7K26_00665 [Candidatus Aenigmarchaeota archaeon]|nr:hypothetical protein [Candidatus Aenigmarchaeota archaeon]